MSVEAQWLLLAEFQHCLQLKSPLAIKRISLPVVLPTGCYKRPFLLGFLM